MGPGYVLCVAKNVGCIGDATIFSIFQYYMYRDNSILRRRAARSAVLHSSYRRSWDPAMCCVQRKACKKCRMYWWCHNLFNLSIYMYRDNSILRRRAARSAVARRQLPWVMGPGYVLCERKACKKCRMYTVMPQSFNIIPACMYRDSSILRRRAARIEQFLNSPIQFIDYMKLINSIHNLRIEAICHQLVF